MPAVRDWHGIAARYRRTDGTQASALRDLVAGRPRSLDRDGVRAAWGEVDDPYATVVPDVRRAPCKVVAPMPLAFGAWTGLFDDAVARIARVAVEPMLALGGGLDAAAVLMAWRTCGVAMPAVATFATGLPGYDEVDLARAIARVAGVTCEVVEVAPAELVARAPMAAIAAETPFYNLHPVHRLVLAQVRGRGGATVLLPRYNHQRSTVITSNIPWEGWGDYLGDHLGATALVDRLLHHSHVIVINGPSYRDWEHKQDAGTVRAATAPTTATAKPPEPAAAPATSGGARRRGK
jgi:hypothetical protein